MFINNIIFRPLELEKISCYELITHYEMITHPKKDNLNGDLNIEGKKIYNLCEEHSSYKYLVMRKRDKIVIPSITSVKLFPNIKELSLNNEDTDDQGVIDKREKYGQIALLLFYPYRDKDDLKLNGSYWKRYRMALMNNLISKKCLEVMQNIQDVTYNCIDLKVSSDILEKTTEYIPHQDDLKIQKTDNENTVFLREYEGVLFDLISKSSHGIRDVDTCKRSLNIIANRSGFIDQQFKISSDDSYLSWNNILQIPEILLSERKEQKSVEK